MAFVQTELLLLTFYLDLSLLYYLTLFRDPPCSPLCSQPPSGGLELCPPHMNLLDLLDTLLLEQ